MTSNTMREKSPIKLSPTQQAANKTSASLTALWHEIPVWLQDNHYIQRGYRYPSNSYWKSAGSITYLHNESVNIWTHLIGAMLATAAAIVLYWQVGPLIYLADANDVMVFSCFFAGAIACLTMSATYHTLSNHSQSVAKFGNRLDYMGIVFLIWGSFVPSIYYGFSAEPNMRRAYWTMISSIGVGTTTAIFYPKFRTPEWRPLRAAMFVAMGLSAMVPVLHGLQIYGLKGMEKRIGLSWLVLQGVLYISGAAIYAERVPERWRPGKFDIWGSSHQIFHVLVVLAAATHLVGLLKAFEHEHRNRVQTFT